MATRTQKAKAKAAEGKGPEGKAAPKPKSAPAGKTGKQGKSKSTPRGKGGKGRKEDDAVVFDEVTGWPEALDAVRAKGPSFMERLRMRRAEKATAREEERLRKEAERKLAEARQRQVEEEQRVLREAQEEQQRLAREAEEKEREAQRKAEERKERAAAKRAEAKAAKEAAERSAAEEAERQAAAEEAAKAQRAAERRAKREQEAAEEARLAEEKAAAQEAAKAHRAAERQRKREELEAEERRLAAEQAERDAEAEVEARRLAEGKRLAAEARKADREKAKELEPDLEFEEASKPVKDSDALVPAKGAASAADAQADLVAAELAKRRSKPLVIVGDLPEPPKIPKAPLRAGESFEPPAPVAPQATEGRAGEAQPTDTFGFSIPEAFLLLANGGGWDERAEKNREGFFGGALAGAMVLELLMRGQVIVQRDRIVLTGEPTDDEALAAIVAALRRIRETKGDLTSLQQMGQLAKRNRDLLTPFKQRLADKGLATYGSRKHLGLFHRSWVEIADEGAQERLQNRLRRAIAGGGTPEAASILLLGLLDASGLFDTVVPDEAADYNRKRLNGLLGGRDIMGYKVDPQLKALQEIATRAVLNNVRLMTVRG
jgi:hypothetical protein